jgi:hypothetical protein
MSRRISKTLNVSNTCAAGIQPATIIWSIDVGRYSVRTDACKALVGSQWIPITKATALLDFA